MKNKTLILDMNGKIIKREIKTDTKGDEYITHKKMKAYLEVNKIFNTPNGHMVTVKQISYYMWIDTKQRKAIWHHKQDSDQNNK